MSTNVTTKVDFLGNDDECLPILKCVCGKIFPAWTFIISIYEDTPTPCPDCGRKLWFSMGIQVYEIE